MQPTQPGWLRLPRPAVRVLRLLRLIGYQPTEPETLARQITRKLRGRLITVGLLASMGLMASVGTWVLDIPDLWLAGLAAFMSAVIVASTPVATMHPRYFHVLPALILVPWAMGVVLLAPDGGIVAAQLVFIGPTIAFVIQGRIAQLVHWVVTSALVAALIVFADTSPATDAALVAALLCAMGLAAFILFVWRTAEEQGTMLEHLVRRDQLTGVGNRRLLDERLEYEIARHSRTGHPLTLLIFDLNGFKQVNDRLGHAAGDQLLQEVGAVLTASLRRQDTVARPGGDEFCVVAPETSAADAEQLIAQLRGALATINAGGRPLTSAIGAATFPDDGDDVQRLMTVADERQRIDKPRSSIGLPDIRPAAEKPAPLPVTVTVPGNVPLASGEDDHVPLSRRVARQPGVRIAVMAVFLIGALAAVLGARIVDRPELLLLAPVATLVGLGIRVVPNDRMPAWMFNLCPIVAAVVIAFGVWAAGADWFIVSPFFMFVGAAIGFMVETSRGRAAHTAFASVVILLPLGYLPLTDVSVATVVASLLGLWAMVLYIRLSWVLVEEQSQELGRLMRRDPLTGVGNRRLLVERLDYELTRHQRTGRPLALIVLDLNDFKGINDTLGHLAGDEVLKKAAVALRGAVRRQDTVARQGGDEFAILAPEAGHQEAARIARHVREALGDVDAGTRNLAGAVGFAVFPEDAGDRESLVELADARQRADKGPRRVAAKASRMRKVPVWYPGADVHEV